MMFHIHFRRANMKRKKKEKEECSIATLIPHCHTRTSFDGVVCMSFEKADNFHVLQISENHTRPTKN